MRKILCILFGILFFVSVTAFGAGAAEESADHWISGDKAGAAEKYWTKERMKNAKPYPQPGGKGIGHRAPANAPEEVSGPPGVDQGHPGNSDPDSFMRPGFAKPGAKRLRTEVGAVEATGFESVGYNFPAPHTTFPVAELLYGTLVTPYPYRTIGKVFFTEHGDDYECSGASIGGRAVLTAGHCVSDGEGVYHSNWIFVPSYKKGEAPYGRWSAFWLTTFPEFHKNMDRARDVGFAAVNDKVGVKLSEAVGYLGFTYNAGRIRHWNVFGYPADDPWDGELMVETQASFAYVDDAVTPKTVAVGTTQTGGCSGGPWILKFKPGPAAKNANLANGVNSYALEDDGEIYSPYFDARVKALKDKATAR